MHFSVTSGVHSQLPCPLIGEANQARTVGKFIEGPSTMPGQLKGKLFEMVSIELQSVSYHAPSQFPSQ